MTPEMRTRSPAFSAWTSASESGVRTSFCSEGGSAPLPKPPPFDCAGEAGARSRSLIALPLCAGGRDIRFPRRGAAPPFRTSPLRWRRQSRRSNGGDTPTRGLCSQRDFLVPVRVAFDGHRHGERGDVTRGGEHVDAERGGVAAVALRPDAKAVGAREQLLLQRVEGRIRVGRAELAKERLLGQDRRLLERTADADPEDERRTGVGAGRLHALDDEVLHPRQPRRRGEHRVLRAVLAAAALGHEHELEHRAGHDADVDDRRRRVAGVHAVEGRAHDGGAQVAFLVALAHAPVDGVVQAAARDVYVLAQLDEADHHARVLAVRNLPRAGHLGVLLQNRQHLLAGGRALGAERTVERAQHVRLEIPVRLHAELADGVGDGRDVDLAHQGPPGLSFAIADFARSACSRGDTSSLWVARLHWLPNGSSSLPKRSPQNMSVTGMRTLQPASTARLKAASTSGSYRKSPPVVPPSALGARAVLMPGNSSLSMTTESPMRSSACMILPPGPGMRSFSRAPKART